MFVNHVQTSNTVPCENSIKVVPKYGNPNVPGSWFKTTQMASSISTKANAFNLPLHAALLYTSSFSTEMTLHHTKMVHSGESTPVQYLRLVHSLETTKDAECS